MLPVHAPKSWAISTAPQNHCSYNRIQTPLLVFFVGTVYHLPPTSDKQNGIGTEVNTGSWRCMNTSNYTFVKKDSTCLKTLPNSYFAQIWFLLTVSSHFNPKKIMEQILVSLPLQHIQLNINHCSDECTIVPLKSHPHH